MPQTLIHALAYIDPEASIGDGVRIDPFAVVEAGAVIGDGTHVQSHAHICTGARIGRECEIYTGAVVGAAPQDLKYAHEPTTATIGDSTTIREYVTVHRGTVAHGNTSVGRGCLLMAYTHVAHDCVIGDNVILANGAQLGGHVTIDDWAIVGGLTGVHQFERIGKHAMVGAGFRVMKDVPPFALAGNHPLGFSGVNVIGLQRRGFPQEIIETIRGAYRLVYQAGVNIGDGARMAADTFNGTPEVRDIVEFILSSERGVIPLSR